ncbi:Histone acetyltransferase [Hibiscus syriacus]|uniref:Histone acetyltransferase n=1 Tax=Hibiscus syriacus TaxID=106335 RepID=A0A6A2YBF2_HIBSY|nr:Histone acetyltransferase [Hibiscus syriacus]
MSRSHSEGLERFLDEFSCAGENVICPSLEPSQPSISKAEEVMEILTGSSKVQGQGETDVTPCGILAELTTQKKSGVQVRQATSGSSREDSDSDELEGDTETADMDPADAKRARRYSRRRKQVQMNGLEAQVGQLRVEHFTLLQRLTDMNHEYDGAAVDNRIMKADIETLRAKGSPDENLLPDANSSVRLCQIRNIIKHFMVETVAGMTIVKMAEETVKRVTGINPGLISRPNIPRHPFLSSPLEASSVAPLPLQSNANQFFHHPVPSMFAPTHHHTVDNSFKGNTFVPPDMNLQAKIALVSMHMDPCLVGNLVMPTGTSIKVEY